MRHKRTRDIVIELTSLLDIVMILVFAVMIQNAKLVDANNQKITEIEAKNKSMEDELNQLSGIAEELAIARGKLDEGDIDTLLDKYYSAEKKLGAYEYMENVIVVFNVGLENRHNNMVRSLTYGVASDKNSKIFDVNKSLSEDWERAINSLKLAVNEFVQEETKEDSDDKYLYIVFSYDPNKVYGDDFKDIDDALKNIETKYGSDKIRYQSNDITEE